MHSIWWMRRPLAASMTQAGALLDKLAATAPTTLACMHGSAWRGDGAALLRALATEWAA